VTDPNRQVLGEHQLNDGRTLAYAQCGDLDGKPVFFFQGAPSTRFFHPDGVLAAQMGARLITIDRPGFGASTFCPDRKVLDWPDDVVALAEHLGINRFAVAGISGGGPYAAACACKIPQRLTHVAILGGFGPVYLAEMTEGMPRERRFAIWLVRYAPWLLRPLFWAFRHPGRNPERFFERYTAHNSASDRAYLDRPEVRAMLVNSYRESVRQGVRGFAWEIVILTRPWGFRLEDIEIEVHIWHGDEDWSTPVVMAYAMTDAIPNSRLTVLSGEGHFLLFRHWEEILEDLLNEG
jgi:pimeloyl-ACP methyl ester carboxylesterase